jgi:hypothetical protein
MPNAQEWEALFLWSPSPGAVFRFLERQKALGKALPETVLLSEPISRNGCRVLIATPSSRETLLALGELLSVAFPPHVGMLFRSGNEWGNAVCSKGVLTSEAREPISPPSPLERILSVIPGTRQSVPPYVTWAKSQGFPAQRIPALYRGKPIETVGYRTISALDERNLLIEEKNRLYRFTLSS